jgi:hypothetical protein
MYPFNELCVINVSSQFSHVHLLFKNHLGHVFLFGGKGLLQPKKDDVRVKERGVGIIATGWTTSVRFEVGAGIFLFATRARPVMGQSSLL